MSIFIGSRRVSFIKCYSVSMEGVRAPVRFMRGGIFLPVFLPMPSTQPAKRAGFIGGSHFFLTEQICNFTREISLVKMEVIFEQCHLFLVSHTQHVNH